MRVLAGAVLGYVVVSVVVFAALSIGFRAVGPDVAFWPGTYEASGAWIALSFVIGFASAFAGGRVASLVAPGGRAVVALAFVLFALGVLFALAPLVTDLPPVAPRPEGPLDVTAAMQHARTPTWVGFVNPFIGVAGVLLGGRRRG
jgi:hypothetical protein